MKSLRDVKRWNKCDTCGGGCHHRCKKFKSITNCPYCSREDKKCCICYEPNNDKYPLSCGHWVHRECILKSERPQCPLCRKMITDLEKSHRIRHTNGNDYDEEVPVYVYAPPHVIPQLAFLLEAGLRLN